MILRNAARCAACGDIIESTHRHDFKTCACSAIFVDGGRTYLRGGWQERWQFEDLSEVTQGGPDNPRF